LNTLNGSESNASTVIAGVSPMKLGLESDWLLTC
jgi:hypothetical protein